MTSQNVSLGCKQSMKCKIVFQCEKHAKKYNHGQHMTLLHILTAVMMFG